MSQSNRPKPGLLQTLRRMVLTVAVLAVVTVATIVGAGCMMPTPSSSLVATAPTTTSAPTAATKQTPASAAPSTGQASLTQVQGEGHSRSVPMRWQESNATSKGLLSTEGNGANPAMQLISIEFSGSLETANGMVSSYSNCNRFSGSYERLTSGMRFGNLVSTHMTHNPARMESRVAFPETLKSPLATVGMQPPTSDKQGRQVIWKTTSGALLQFVEWPLPPRGQTC